MQLIHNRHRRTSPAGADIVLGRCPPRAIVDKRMWSGGLPVVGSRHIRSAIPYCRLQRRRERASLGAMRTVLLLAAGLAVPACGARAASFDCAKAATAVENAICADPALSQADEHMAQA